MWQTCQHHSFCENKYLKSIEIDILITDKALLFCPKGFRKC